MTKGLKDQIDQMTRQTIYMKFTRFEDLECWQEARSLVNLVYKVTKGKEFKKDLRLSGQIQAAATSTMANIAEGLVRRSDREFTQFLYISMSSAAEVQSHLYIALDQGYIDQDQFNIIYEQANKTARIISGLIKYLRTNPTK